MQITYGYVDFEIRTAPRTLKFVGRLNIYVPRVSTADPCLKSFKKLYVMDFQKNLPTERPRSLNGAMMRASSPDGRRRRWRRSALDQGERHVHDERRRRWHWQLAHDCGGRWYTASRVCATWRRRPTDVHTYIH